MNLPSFTITRPPLPTKKASSFLRSPILFLTLLFSLFFLIFLHTQPTLLTFSDHDFAVNLAPIPPICLHIPPEKFLTYAPHSGFSNQLSEFKNALVIARILNRTLVVPPILDHHAVALGSCPKFRVSSPREIRRLFWDHAVDLIRTGRYVSIADIVDLSSLISSSSVRVIDFRLFAQQFCSLTLDIVCGIDVDANKLRQCGSLLSGNDGNVSNCLYAVEEDCRTTVWTFRNGYEDGALDSFQPDEELKKRKKISYVRRRRDVYKNLGPDSEANSAALMAFGSVFSSPYKGSESYIDIHESPRDQRIQSLIEKIEFLPFVPEITNAGKRFVDGRIQAPFLCAQLRLLDGQFKNHRNATFLGLKQKIESLDLSSHPLRIFVMTDLPEANWTGTYLGDLARDSHRFKLFSLEGGGRPVIQTALKLVDANHGLASGFLPKHFEKDSNILYQRCRSKTLPDVRLFVEETICSCASLGFVGTAGSTIAESIERMRKFGVCSSRRTAL